MITLLRQLKERKLVQCAAAYPTLLVSTLSLLATGCAPTPIQSDTQVPAEDEYQVYACILRTFLDLPVEDSPPGDYRKPERLVIQSQSRLFFNLDSFGEKYIGYIERVTPGEPAQGLVDHFIEQNREPTTIENRFGMPDTVVLVPEDTVRWIFGTREDRRERGWQYFRRRYSPSWLIRLSRVGFDQERDRALVTVSAICGGLCGHGARYVLRRVGAEWVIVDKETTSVR